jgi:hypothetical protein
MKAKRYDTVQLSESIGSFPKGEKGAVVETYCAPYEAYDIELVADDGHTYGLLEAVRPEQFNVIARSGNGVRLASVRLEHEGTRIAIAFSDGKRMRLTAEELYSLAK